jgi:uncharacterized membrane protein YtjA (UPF0391 family)
MIAASFGDGRIAGEAAGIARDLFVMFAAVGAIPAPF